MQSGEDKRQLQLSEIAKLLNVPVDVMAKEESAAKEITYEAIQLLQAFFKIKNHNIRQRCIEFVERASQEEQSAQDN